MSSSPSRRRILLKLSGESLTIPGQYGIDQAACRRVALAIKALKDSNFDVAIVTGGGNICRGLHLEGLGVPRTPADQMGMLSTLINGIALQQALIEQDIATNVMSALACPQVAESYVWTNAMQHLAAGRVVIFVGGTGNPYFSTDTAAALRACEIKADMLVKATKVDGIYSKDPLKHPDAQFYPSITYSKILMDQLAVMDNTSIALCRTNHVPIFVFNMTLLDQAHIVQALSEQRGTLVKGE